MKQSLRHLLRKRAVFAFIDGLILILSLLFLMIIGVPAAPTRSITYLKSPGHLLVQLAELPEHSEAETRTMPEWTLYGDGTLLFQSDRHEDLWRAHLSPDAVQHILDVIINQNQFFACSMQQYGTGSNDDRQLLMVDANGRQKAVTLTDDLSSGRASSIETTRIIAIEQFLLAYQPTRATWYAPDPDPDDTSHEPASGVVDIHNTERLM
jgi:hypothetical protein